jgi:hypothetical protein
MNQEGYRLNKADKCRYTPDRHIMNARSRLIYRKGPNNKIVSVTDDGIKKAGWQQSTAENAYNAMTRSAWDTCDKITTAKDIGLLLLN